MKTFSLLSQVAAHIVQHLGISEKECKEEPMVTLLQRKNRVILNMDELRQTAIKVGFTNIIKTVFEDISTIEQMKIIRCTRVFVGVHGAGLAWGLFLRKKTALLEIAWPQHGWPFMYSGS